MTGVEWRVEQTSEGAAESAAERRSRRRKERLSAVEAHPRIREALRAFPGSRVLRVDEPEALEGFLEDDDMPVSPHGENIVHVDFSGHGRSQEIEIEPDPEESDD